MSKTSFTSEYNRTHALAKYQVNRLLKYWDITEDLETDRFVFFDIDGTLSREDNLALLITELARREFFSKRKVNDFLNARRLYKTRKWTFEAYLQTVIAYIKDLRLIPKKLLLRIAKSTIRTQGRFYYVFTRTLLLSLKELDYKLIAVSGAPEFMVKEFLRVTEIPADEIHATKFEFAQEIFTGKVDITVVTNKGKFLREKYGAIIGNKSVAIGDTIGDSNMFPVVEHCVAINPVLELAMKAMREKWPIVIERKNLILLFAEGNISSAIPYQAFKET